MKRRVSFKKQAHYAGSVGCMVLAGGPWGVIRAVTGRITQCLSSVATSPGGEVEEGTGNGWEVLDPCWELLGLSVSQVTWDWTEGTGRVGLPELITSVVGRDLLFLEVFYEGSMPLPRFSCIPTPIER